MSNQYRTCRYCRFSTPIEGNMLQCCRNPPVVIPVPNDTWRTHGTFRPTVNADETCGEWKDDSTSPETEARNELRQQLVVAMVAAGSNMNMNPGALWEEASRIADCDPEVNNE